MVIPVMDLMGGVVVRGVAGKRSEYQAIESCFARDARPATVGRALIERFGFHRAYVADLDSIGGAEPDWRSLHEIAASGLELLVDAGINGVQRAARLADRCQQLGAVSGVIVGLESVRRPEDLPRILRAIGPQRAIFSIDLLNGRPLSSATLWKHRSADQIAAVAVSAGFQRLIVLDLAAVGVNGGPRVVDACRQVRRTRPTIELISGGGVGRASDLTTFIHAGCDAILIASALHDGRVSPGDLAGFIG